MPRNKSYADEIKINTDDLITEWQEQPVLMMKYSDLFAAAVFERDTAKVKLDYVEAQIDSEIRKDYKKFGYSSKPTEAAIKNIIISNKKYRKALKKVVYTTKQANHMSGVRTSFEHRKKALENLVTLLVTGFHSEPKNKVRDIKNVKFKKLHEHQKTSLKGGKRNNRIKQSQKAE
jgi:hypothetical protein